MKIKIPTRFLPDDHQVFVLHPGKSKRFYFDFIEQSRVFLDFPGASLPKDVDALSYDVQAQLRTASEIGRWLRYDPAHNPKPDSDYKKRIPKGKEGKKSKSAPLYAHEAEGLYKKAKKGDLIIVPGSGYMSEVFFGEITHDFDPSHSATAEIYGRRYPIPARRVKWIKRGLPKRHFSDKTIKLLQNRRAIIKITSAVEKREIYNAVYGDYIEQNLGVGRIYINKETVDVRAINNATNLILYYIAMQKAIELGEEENFLDLSIALAVEKYYDPNYIFDTSIEIKSPGYISLFANKLAVPLFVIVMLAASAAGASSDAVAGAEIIPHASAANDPCYLEVSERVKGMMEMMHADRWQELCRLRQEAANSVGMDQNAKVSDN